MKKLGNLNVIEPMIEGVKSVVIEIPKLSSASGFSDSDRKKLEDNGFIIMQNKRAFQPPEASYEESIAKLEQLYRTGLTQSNYKPALETHREVSLFPRTIVIDSNAISPFLQIDGGIKSVVFDLSKHKGTKLEEFMNRLDFITQAGDNYFMDLSKNNTLSLREEANSLGAGNNVNLLIDSYDSLPRLRRQSAIRNIIPVVTQKGNVFLMIIPSNQVFDPKIKREIDSTLNFKGTSTSLSAEATLQTISGDGETTPIKIESDIEVIMVKASQNQRQQNENGYNKHLGPNYRQQAQSLGTILYEYQQTAPISIQQQYKNDGSLSGRFIVSVPVDLKERMRALVGTTRKLDDAESPIYSDFNSKSIIGYNYNFNKFDAISVLEDTKDLQSFSGPLTPEQIEIRGYSNLPYVDDSPKEIANADYRSHVTSESDVLNLLAGTLNTPYTDDILRDLNSALADGTDTSGIDWEGSMHHVQANKGAFIIKASKFKCSYNDNPKSDRDMFALITVFNDKTANIQIRKGGQGDGRIMSSHHIGKSITESYKTQSEEAIAKVAHGGDYSQIIAKREADEELNRKRQEERLKQIELDKIESQKEFEISAQAFSNDYANADQSLQESKEYKKKGLSVVTPRKQTQIRRGTTTRFDESRTVNLETIFIPYTLISTNQPERDNDIVTGQRIIHDGSGKSFKPFITGSSLNEHGLGEGNFTVYQTKPINNTYNEYVLSEGWAEAEWYAAHLEKRGINDVWVSAAGSAHSIKTAMRILNQKYPDKILTVLADNDVHKKYTSNAGLNAFYEGAQEILSHQSSDNKNLSNLRLTTIPADVLARNQAGVFTDVTDLTGELPSSQTTRIFKSLGISNVNVYSGDGSNVQGTYIPEDTDPMKALDLIKKSSSENFNININLARPVLSDAVFDYLRESYVDIRNNPASPDQKGANHNSTLLIAVERSKIQAVPVEVGMILNDYKVENGQPTFQGISSLSGDMEDLNMEINDHNEIVHNRDNNTGNSYIPDHNQRPHFVSADGVLTDSPNNVTKQLASSFQEGDSFSTPIMIPLKINQHFSSFFKNSVEEAFSAKEEGKFDRASKMASLIRKNSLDSMEPHHVKALKDLAKAIQNNENDVTISRVKIPTKNLGDSLQKKLILGMADQSVMKDYVNSVTERFTQSLIRQSEVDSTEGKLSQDQLNKFTKGKDIVLAVEQAGGMYTFPAAQGDGTSIVTVSTDPLKADVFSISLKKPESSSEGVTFEMTRDELIADSEVKKLIAYFPSAPFTARTEAIMKVHAKRLSENLITQDQYESTKKSLEKASKQVEMRNAFLAAPVDRSSFVVGTNIEGKSLGVSLNNRIVDVKDEAESYLKIPMFSLDMSYRSQRGSKEFTNDSWITKQRSDLEKEIEEAKESGKPSEMIAYLDKYKRGELEANIKNAQKALQQGHHTKGKEGASKAVFATNLAFVMKKKDGSGFNKQSRGNIEDMVNRCEVFRENYLSHFGLSLPADKTKQTTFMQEMVPFNVPIVGLKGITHELEGDKKAKWDYSVMNIKNSAYDYVRAVCHDQMSGSRVQAYKFPNPDSKYNVTDSRMYRGSTLDLETTKKQIEQLNKDGFTFAFKEINCPPTFREAKSHSGEKLFALIVPVKARDANGMEFNPIEKLNNALAKLKYLSKREFEHLENPAKVESPFTRARDKGVSERECRELIASYADSPPEYNKLKKDDPGLLAIQQRAEILNQQRQERIQKRSNSYLQEKSKTANRTNLPKI